MFEPPRQKWAATAKMTVKIKPPCHNDMPKWSVVCQNDRKSCQNDTNLPE